MERDSLQTPARREGADSLSLRAELIRLLQTTQNKDGGWGFHPEIESRVEPTCWAAMALNRADQTARLAVTRAVDFLKACQLSDGSWPATAGMSTGSWVTSLACMVLSQCSAHPGACEAGLKWLCDDYPRDSSPWQRFLGRFASKKNLVSHNDEYRGWGWTPHTSSWVEPTAFALMALAGANSRALASQIEQRCALAKALLYDRMCSGGGWNCGNPRVYGVDGDALVLPTCWALLALRDDPDHPKRAMSLAWLGRQCSQTRGAGSLAAATVTLKTYGIEPPPGPAWCDQTAEEILAQGIHVAAWVATALSPSPSLFADRPGAAWKSWP